MSPELFQQELGVIVLQYLRENNMEESAHQLEKELGIFLDLNYLGKLATKGAWDDIESYLFAFTRIEENPISLRMFFEIRKQKYLEALDRKDKEKAIEILCTELKVFKVSNEKTLYVLTKLLTCESISYDMLGWLHLSEGAINARMTVFNTIKLLIQDNPVLGKKLEFPLKKNGRLAVLLNQSFLYQHHNYCKDPRRNPEFKSFFMNHTCDQPSKTPVETSGYANAGIANYATITKNEGAM